MKILILLALAGVSVCQDNDGNQPKPQPPTGCGSSSSGLGGQPSPSSFQCDTPNKNNFSTDDACLKHALENVPQLLLALNNVFCKFKRNEANRADEFHLAAKNEIIEIVKCSGCEIGGIVGLKELVGETGAAAGGVTGDAATFVAETLTAVGVAPPVATLVCDLLCGLFTSKCVAHITNAKQKTLDTAATIKTLGDIGCLGGALLGIDDKTLEKLSTVLGESLTPALRNLIETVKGLPAVGPVVSSLLCTVTGVVKDVLGGGGIKLLNIAG
ncbi:uncharacterized protein [Dendropsophus ebraccatus]|uniref:uncharacterized protein isoform X2 n=1 Tax=Dendropsophus ebraccatus TaxID=150705 RepID=UPI0038316E9B